MSALLKARAAGGRHVPNRLLVKAGVADHRHLPNVAAAVVAGIVKFGVEVLIPSYLRVEVFEPVDGRKIR